MEHNVMTERPAGVVGDAAEKAEFIRNVNYTPDETGYELWMWDDDGFQVQGLSLNRNEYIALKRHLAKIRGIEVAESGSGRGRPGESASAAGVPDPRSTAGAEELFNRGREIVEANKA